MLLRNSKALKNKKSVSSDIPNVCISQFQNSPWTAICYGHTVTFNLFPKTLIKSVDFESPWLPLPTVRWLTTSEAICLAILFFCFSCEFAMEQSCNVPTGCFIGTGSMLFFTRNLLWDTKHFLLLVCALWGRLRFGMVSNLCSLEPLAAVMTWRKPTHNWAHPLSSTEGKGWFSSPRTHGSHWRRRPRGPNLSKIYK